VSNRIREQLDLGRNGNKNININNTVGPLPNDPMDPDGGPNNQQNYPGHLARHAVGREHDVVLDLSTPLRAARIQVEFFENPRRARPPGVPRSGRSACDRSHRKRLDHGDALSRLHDFISMTADGRATATRRSSRLIVAVTPTPRASDHADRAQLRQRRVEPRASAASTLTRRAPPTTRSHVR
jgi:hypothetical protein